MASSSSTGLKDLLSPQPNPNNNMLPAASRPQSPSDVEVGQKSEELSVESSASSPPLNTSSSQSLQYEMFVPYEPNMSLTGRLVGTNLSTRCPLRENSEKVKEEVKSDQARRCCPEGIHLGKKVQHNVNKQFAGKKCFFPPPISCLKKVKDGKSYKYVTYDKESDSNVVEEIKIPDGSLFNASRENGRLKLSMKFEDEEEMVKAMVEKLR